MKIVNVKIVFRIIWRGYSLIGKTSILHIVNSRSTLDISKVREAQSGWAEHWRCLGCKFESYLEHMFMGVLKFGNQVPLRMEWYLTLRVRVLSPILCLYVAPIMDRTVWVFDKQRNFFDIFTTANKTASFCETSHTTFNR